MQPNETLVFSGDFVQVRFGLELPQSQALAVEPCEDLALCDQVAFLHEYLDHLATHSRQHGGLGIGAQGRSGPVGGEDVCYGGRGDLDRQGRRCFRLVRRGYAGLADTATGHLQSDCRCKDYEDYAFHFHLLLSKVEERI